MSADAACIPDSVVLGLGDISDLHRMTPTLPDAFFCPPPFKPVFHFLTAFPVYGLACSRQQYLDATYHTLSDVLSARSELQYATKDSIAESLFDRNCAVLHVAAAACASGLVVEGKSGEPDVLLKPRLQRLMSFKQKVCVRFVFGNVVAWCLRLRVHTRRAWSWCFLLAKTPRRCWIQQ